MKPKKPSILARLRSAVNVLATLRAKIAEQDTEIQHLRAQLMQLRVWQTSENHRVGFMVSAFIPEEVVETMRKRPAQFQEAFTTRIAHKLVQYAVDRIYHVSAKGTMQALIFEPIKKAGSKPGVDRTVSPIFEMRKPERLANGEWETHKLG